MEPTTLGVLFTAFFGAISSLFWLYVRELQGQIGSLRDEKNTIANKLETLALKADETSRAEQEATRKELAQLRETNAALVAAQLADKAVSS